jgi:hypothetical protein
MQTALYTIPAERALKPRRAHTQAGAPAHHPCALLIAAGVERRCPSRARRRDPVLSLEANVDLWGLVSGTGTYAPPPFPQVLQVDDARSFEFSFQVE